MTRHRRSGWLFGLALKLFPRWFRDRYGRDMVTDYLDSAARIRATDGVLAEWWYRLRSFVDIPGMAWHVRWTDRGRATGGRSVRTAHAWGDDVRLALRSLRRAPGWTAAALAILTLGIGGTTAVFSVLNAVLLRPLPYDRPESLISLWTVNRNQDLPDGSSWENARDWVERSRALVDAALVFRPEFTAATVSSFGEPERIHVGLVTANFFSLLGIAPVAGRLFGPADLDTDARVAVISQGLWAERFGGDPAAVGRTLTIDGEEVRIIGVAPSGLTIPREETRIWQATDPRPPAGQDFRGWDAYWVIGRLEHGVTVAMAQRELDGIAGALAREHPETNRGRGVRVTSLHAEIVGDRLPLLLWTLFGSMVLVLAIGGTNVAQLVLTRGLERRREMAVKMSLGATRARLNRQLLLESLLISLLAGLGGLLLARLGLHGLVALIPSSVPLTQHVTIDRAVLGAAIGASAVVAPLVGLLPALAASRTDASAVLRSGGRGSTRNDRRLRSALVVAEVAMAFVLLSGAGLLVRSAIRLQAVDPGFDARHTLVARIHFRASLQSADRAALQSALVDRLRLGADVTGAGAIGSFFIERIPDQGIVILDAPPPDATQPAPRLTTDWIVPGFFESLGVPLLAGRSLEPADVGPRPRSVLVNQRWVETFARGRDPVGLRFRWHDQVEGDPVTVVGVVGDLRRTTLEEVSFPQMYVAGAGPAIDLVIRTRGDPLAVAPAVREAVRALDPMAAVSHVTSAWDRYHVGLAPRHFQTLLFIAFAGLATVLAAIGLFAILHDAVASRRREFGIRLALGAAPAGVRRMVLWQGLSLSAAGLGLGLVGVTALSSIWARIVYGVTGTDPVTLAAAAALLLLVSVLASAVPAARVTRVSPAESLASE